jgi:hypothetical protein
LSDTSASYEDYTVHEDRSSGRVEWSRDAEEAPKRIAVTLELIQKAAPGLVTVVNLDRLVILNDRYRITGWDPNVYALICELEPE